MGFRNALHGDTGGFVIVSRAGIVFFENRRRGHAAFLGGKVAIAAEFAHAVDDAGDDRVVLDAGHLQDLGSGADTATVDGVKSFTGNAGIHDGLERAAGLHTRHEAVLTVKDVAVFIQLDGFAVQLPTVGTHFVCVDFDRPGTGLAVEDTGSLGSFEKVLCETGSDDFDFGF